MSKYFVIAFVAVVLLTAFAPTPVKADSIDTFVFVTCEGPPSGCGPGSSLTANTYAWQAPSSPIPTSFAGQYGCYIQPGPGMGLTPRCFSISADVAANGTDLGSQTITFGLEEPIYGGGFDIPAIPSDPNCPIACGPVSGAGPAVWSGSTLSPTFIPGTYTMVASDLPSPDVGTLTITSATATPEPSVLLQTGAGLLLGFAVIALWGKQSFGAARS